MIAKLICKIFGHRYEMHQFSWLGENHFLSSFKCGRCGVWSEGKEHKRPYNWDEIPF